MKIFFDKVWAVCVSHPVFSIALAILIAAGGAITALVFK